MYKGHKRIVYSYKDNVHIQYEDCLDQWYYRYLFVEMLQNAALP